LHRAIIRGGRDGDSIRVLHRLTRIGAAMAGPDIADPYKD
jgi:hypothetical protein